MPISQPKAEITDESRRSLKTQSFFSGLLSPLWMPIISLVMRWGMRWRIRDLRALRKQYRELRGKGPMLVCANHLTMADSAVIACALGSPWFFAKRWFSLPWNVPEWENFAFSRGSRLMAWLTKCVPIRRGGSTESIADSLNRLTWLLMKGQTVMIFPEAGRSRTGRISLETPAHGIGRLLTRVPDTRVLCIYARGDKQSSWSHLPARGDHFHVAMQEIEPRTERGGIGGSRDLTLQILDQLVTMEGQYFQSRSPTAETAIEQTN